MPVLFCEDERWYLRLFSANDGMHVTRCLKLAVNGAGWDVIVKIRLDILI